MFISKKRLDKLEKRIIELEKETRLLRFLDAHNIGRIRKLETKMLKCQ